MINVFFVFSLALAVWRIAYMIANESGVGGVFARFRAFAGVIEYITAVEIPEAMADESGTTVPSITYDPISVPLPPALQPSYLAEGITCIRCLSVWIGIVTAVCAGVFGLAAMTAVLLPFTLSAMAIIIDEKLT